MLLKQECILILFHITNIIVYDVPVPKYHITGNSIMLKFTVPKNRIVRTSAVRVTDGVTDRVTDGVTDLNDSEKAVLSLLLENPEYTYAALSEKLNISRKTVSLRIRHLKEKGIIQRAGSDANGYWKINQ